MTSGFGDLGRGTSRPSVRLAGAGLATVLLIAAGLPAGVLADPPSSSGPVDVSAAVRHDVSPPLRTLGPTAPSAATLRERPLRLVGPGSSPNQADGAVQQASGTQVATSTGWNFDGVGVCGASAGCYAPPDTNGAVGATQYVQWVNAAFAVFDKSTGTIATGFPKAGNAVWTGFGGGCQTNNDGDPIVQYDKAANRWILTQFSVSTTPYLQCVAISTTSDATGSYYRYAFSYGSTEFPDYPKLGVWPDAYYVTFNMFTSTFVGAQVCAYDRARMLTGAPATQQCFHLSSSYGGLLPSDLDGSTAPPVGSPNLVMNFGTNSLNLWKFHVDWANTANTTLSGPTNIPVASFSRACNGSNCVPQPGTSQKLDSLGDRLMYRLAYRNFGDHESLVVNHSVSVGGNLFKSGVSSVRWYELRNAQGTTMANGTPVVYQQGTLDASDGIHRWMGSIAMDRAGDIALGYSASSGSVYPSIRYTGRVSTDQLGTMEAENIIQAGSGSQLQNLSRWGDYSAMTVDPVDDCTFWYTNEYLKANGTWNWSTRIASFTFPGCGAAAPDFGLSAAPTSQTVTQGSGTSYTVTVTPSGGFAGSVTLSVSGLPIGATPAFSPNPTTGSSTLSLTTSSTTPAGTYPLTITGTSGSLTHSTSVSLTVDAPDFGLSAAPTSQTVTQGSGTSYTVTVTPSGGFAGSVDLSLSTALPSGVGATFSPNPTTGSSTLSLTTSSTTPAGTYPLTITGTSGSLVHTTSVSLTVNAPVVGDFGLSVSPPSQSVVRGSGTSYTVTVTPSGGFAGSVNLSVSGLPKGVAGSFNPNPTTGSSTLSVTTSRNARRGTYQLTITGTSGSLTHSTGVTLTIG